MMARLRALERKLVRERAELAVIERVNDLAGRWRDALDQDGPMPGVLDFARGLVRAGFSLPTIPRAIQYLTEFRLGDSLPDRGRLLQTLLPWYTYAAHAWS